MTDRTSPEVARAVLLSAFALAALFLLWHLAHVLLLIFGGVLLGVVLNGGASKLAGRTGAPRGVALVGLLVFLLAAALAVGWAVGPPVADQAASLADRLPAAVASVEGSLRETAWGRVLLRKIPSGSGVVGPVTGLFSTLFGAASAVFLVLAMGLFLTVSPQTYVRGALRLVPPDRRARARRFLRAAGRALDWWMVGRLVSMTVVGVLTTAGLWLVDAPLPLSLGFIAGLLSFVPILGPVTSAVPAILLALPEGPRLALWVVVVYLIVQLLETHLITPLVQKEAVYLPPVLLIAGQLVLGVLFGFLGVFLATPFMVAIVVAVQVLYLEGMLGEEIRVLGAHGGEE